MTSTEAKYGLPEEVVFCARCVMSNQRPSSAAEFEHKRDSKKLTLHINEAGVCDACLQAESKEQRIDWDQREAELLRLLDQHRRSDGTYDCVVPGSGGKDSAYAAHVLKYKYGMNPLTVTWPPILYTDYGLRNFWNWLDVGGFDNVSFHRNGQVMKTLTRLAIENLLHPFQTFMLGQKNLAPKIAAKWGIPLIFYGESEAEYGNPIAENASSLRDRSYFAMKNVDNASLAGVPIRELRESHGLTFADLQPFLPASAEELEKAKIEVRYLGYYLRWTPQEVYYYAVENTGFKSRPQRSEGTYSKYNSIDDKIDDLHYYTTYVKFGLGRASYDASQEIRNSHLTRDDGVALVKKFDGEFPSRYFEEVMDFLEMKPDHFIELCDEFRSPHLWGKDAAGQWRLRHNVWGGGLDD